MQILIKIFKSQGIRTSTLSSRTKNMPETYLGPLSLDDPLGIQSYTQKIQFFIALACPNHKNID